jgi:hypothetical protein
MTTGIPIEKMEKSPQTCVGRRAAGEERHPVDRSTSRHQAIVRPSLLRLLLFALRGSEPARGLKQWSFLVP